MIKQHVIQQTTSGYHDGTGQKHGQSVNKGIFMFNNLLHLIFSLTLLASTMAWALSGTKGTPIGGIGTGYIKFDAQTGEFAAGSVIPPAAFECDDEFTSKKSAECGFHLFAGGQSVAKAKTTVEDAKCPLYTAEFGTVNDVSFTLNAFGPFVSGDGDLNYQLATSPLAFFEVTATNTGDTPVEAAVALEFANRNNTRPTLLGGAGDAVIDPESDNHAISYTTTSLTYGFDQNNTLNSANAYLAITTDDSSATCSAGSLGDYLTTGALSNSDGNLVAGKCTITPGDSVRFKFTFAWWRTFLSNADRYGNGKNDEDNYYYHNFYATAKEVATFGMTHFDYVRNSVVSRVKRIMAGNFPEWYKDRLLNNTYPLIHNSVATKDGRTAFWEGTFPTVGIIDQGQHAAVWYINNWPKSQWNELRYFLSTMHTGSGEPEELKGQIHHDFTEAPQNWLPESHFLCPWDNYLRNDYWYHPNTTEWSDLNTMAILKAYELMLATGNKDSMQVYFPKVLITAERLRYMCKQANAHLPLNSKSTYDSDGSATPQYASGMALVAFLAVEEIAKFIGDEATALEYREFYQQAREEFRTEVYEKTDFCKNRSIAEGDVAGYGWARYFCFEPVMDSDIILEGCSRLWDYYSSQQGSANKLGLWHFYTCDHWGGSEIATGNPDRALDIHKWDRDRFYESNPKFVFWQNLWSENNQKYASYMTAPVVWHSYNQFLGYLLDNANKRLWIRPQIPTEMNKIITDAPLINPQGWGTLNYNENTVAIGSDAKKTQTINVTYDSAVTINELILNNNTGSESPSVVLRNGSTNVSDFTLTTEVRGGLEKNIHITFTTPLHIDPSGLNIEVYNAPVGTLTGKEPTIKQTLSILSTAIHANSSIAYSIDKAGEVSIELLQLNGAKIGTIMKKDNHSAGKYSFVWNGKSLEGIPINATNVYILRLKSPSGMISRLVYNNLH